MMVSLQIDGNQLKSEIEACMDRKVQKLYANDKAKHKALDIWYYGYIQPKLSFLDTGSYAWPPVSHAIPSHSYKVTRKWRRKDGSIGTGEYERDYIYPRSGYIDISAHHGIKRDAVEHRPKGDKSYFIPLLCKDFGIEPDDVSGRTIFEAMDAAEQEEFLEKIVREIKVAFKED